MIDRVILITGTRKGLGLFLAQHYLAQGYRVVGCSRSPCDLVADDYEHHCLDVGDEAAVTDMMGKIRHRHGRLDALINNAGTAAMNHVMLTPGSSLESALRTNVGGTFLPSREAARLMRGNLGASSSQGNQP